jgi:hypothetical protein
MQFGVLGPHLIPTLLPFPVRITHVVSPPLDLGDRAAARRSRPALADLLGRVTAQCQHLLDTAVAQREQDAPMLDRAVRVGERFFTVSEFERGPGFVLVRVLVIGGCRISALQTMTSTKKCATEFLLRGW